MRKAGHTFLLVFLALLIGFGVQPARAQERTFVTPWHAFMPGDYFSARYPQRSAVGDFNGDGFPDVATMFNILPRLTVIFNRGTGMYGAPVMYTAPDVSEAVTAGDIDGDGDIDIVVGITGLNEMGTGVALYRNNGDGSFTPPVVVPSGGTAPTDVALADLNNDGRLDIIVAHFRSNLIGILTNQGGGTFSSPATVSCPDMPYQVASADLNGDGWRDIVVTGGPHNSGSQHWVRVFMNNGSGGFGSSVLYAPIFSGIRFYPCIALGDVDLDGDIDVVYAHTGLRNTVGTYVVALLRNQGNGTLASPTGIVLGDFSGSFDSIALVDVTGDGRLDILGTLGSNQGWGVLPNTGGGNFGAFRRYVTAEYPHDVHPADVDGDNDVDVVTTNWLSIEIGVHTNPGNGDFSTPVAATLRSGTYQGFETGDVNHDGKLDVVIGSNPLQVYVGDGMGNLTLRGQFSLGSTAIHDLRLRDMDNDGHLDVVFNEGIPPYRWGISWNDGTGGFSPATLYAPGTCGYVNGEIEAEDLDNDGDLDVILPEDLGCPSIPNSARRVFIIENRGGRNFQLHSEITTNPGPGSIKAGDLDRDGKMDIVIGNARTDILWGNGNLTFTMTSIADLPILELTLADVNNDGNLDILAGLNRQEPYRESLAVLLNNGNRTFQAPAIYLSPHSGDLRQIAEIIVGDEDQDGYLDVFLANYASSTISYFRNRGDGTFERQIGIGTGFSPLDVVFGDFTGDGIGDLVAFHSVLPPPISQNRLHLIRGLGGWTAVLAENFRLIRGRLVSGGLSELQQSDDTYLVLWPGFVLSQAEAPVQLVVEGTAPRVPQGSLRLEVEARVNTTPLRQSIDLYNFTTNQWDTRDTRTATTTDSTTVVEVTTNISAYIDPTTRMVRARVRWQPLGLVLIYPWEVRVDLVRWQIRG